MKNMKFRIESLKHSEAIQKELFRLGFAWYTVGRISRPLGKCYIYAYTCNGDKLLFFGGTDKYFEDHENIETTLEELKLMK